MQPRAFHARMPDVFTKAKRSEVMSRIRSRGNVRTELRLVSVFRELGITGWRRHLEIRKAESGKLKFRVRPDFVFPKRKFAVFVDGCFWHGCPRCYVRPKQNRKFWDAKHEGNMARDKKQSRALRAAGWTVLRLWEHELAKKRAARLVAKLQRVLGRSQKESKRRKEG